MKNIKLLFILIFMTLFCSSCGNTGHDLDTSEEHILDQTVINGGSVGGIWSIFSEGIAEAVRRENPGTMISSAPGTVAGNPILVHEGKADFAVAESLIAQFAYEGKEPFTEQHEHIRAVATIMPVNIFQFVAPVNASFQSVEDIVEHQVGIRYSAGEKGALGDLVSASVFEAYGISYEDIQDYGGEINYLSGGKTFELMADGRIDGLGKMVPIPAGDIMEASATIDMKLIPIGDQAINYLVEKYDMTPYTMPAGSYDFQTEDYHTVNSPTILITHEHMSEEAVYQMTKAIYEQLDYLFDVHRSLQEINDQTIIEVGHIPLHPGAEKFYREQGLIVATD